MIKGVRLVPRVKLWDNTIVLECVCGAAIAYPGHPVEIDIACPCGEVYRVGEPEDIPTLAAV